MLQEMTMYQSTVIKGMKIQLPYRTGKFFKSRRSEEKLVMGVENSIIW